jgi:Ribbon-helix-helix protein, copG family
VPALDPPRVTIYGSHMQKTTVYLDAADYRALKRIAAKRRRPPAELVREAVAEYAARHRARRIPKSVGAFRSGRRDLSERAEELLKGMGRTR